MGDCPICNEPLHYPTATYCKRCKKYIDRVDPRKNPNKGARVKALKEAWDGKCFRCHYTGVELVEDNPSDPRYLTFDHFIPRQEDHIVIVAAAINDMKTDMSDNEFRKMVVQLANRFNGGDFDSSTFKLKHWKR